MAQPVVVSSCINYKWEYDVFLSFHGEDTRLGFVGFLRESLRQRGIRVFYDDDSIRTGEEITPALFKAIQESRIAIIVFSKNYAKSTFCLRELEKILECFTEEGRLVYPVFYYVDPSELRHPSRHPTGSYAEALAGQEERFKDDKQKVEKWRLALSQAANLKGCHLKSQIANEQMCANEITNEVLAKINHNYAFYVTDYPVGLVPRVKQVVSLLDLWSEKKNKMVGIVGPGGIGKSTIARATYNSIGDYFEGLCFLSNVGQMSKVPNGLAHLQEELLCKLVLEKDLKLGDVYEGIPKIQHRLGHKKILLILDDVDELKQLKALAGSWSWFGPGSRIVITTRNKHLLASHDVNNIYHVGELNDEESLQLLSWHAFRTENVGSDFIEVSKRAILYSCGFPLALELIGSNLRDKGVGEWQSALDQYKNVQEERVFGVLRLSYDSLTEIERKFFLDLAFLPNGVELGEVMYMLSCLHGFEPKYAIGVLIDKSLIKIEDDRMFMHDLIKAMGKEIVRQESPNEPGKRSRLWCYEDILHVFEQNTGTCNVEVIVLDLPGDSGAQIQWNGNAFMNMKNLKMLVINNASFSICPTHLPKSLRWLKWKGYPFRFLPDISSTKLFCLDLSCSSFDTLQPFTKTFHTLSRMNFRNCKSLQQIPDLSGVSNLKELWLDGCTKLVEIHHSIGRLNKLKELSAMRCNNLEILPPHLWLTSLEQLNLFGCSSLSSFPDILVEMKYIQTLDIGRTAITALPSSMCNLIGLETLNMEECPYLEQLPTTIYLLPNLWELNANFSKLMTHFKMCEGGEENLGCYAMSLKLGHLCFSNCNLSNDSLALCLSYFTSMIRLDLSFNKFTTLPACIKECHHLRYLLLDHCKRLQHIEEMPPNLEKFSAICCKSLTESSKSKVLYQALNLQTGKTNFILPGREFPENLDNYSRGSCVSFWVRDVFPTIFLWIVVRHDQDFLSNCTFVVHLNDTKLDISSEWHLLSTMKMGHLCICDLQSMIHKDELLQGNRWNRLKVSIKSNTQETKSGRDQFDLALHVSKQQSNSNTIRFMDPRRVYTDSNPWQRVQQPKDLEELKDDVPNRDLARVSLKAQRLPKEALKVKRAILPSRWTYDVFLSYKSDDECYSFVRRLYNSLCQQRIRAFDNDELGKTSRENLKALQESRTAIIVISKSYASSPSCLNSLAIIHECFRMECRFIYPIFYDVEPLELQHQMRSYGEVFARLEKIFKQHVQKWRLALSEVANSRVMCHLTPGLATNVVEDEDAVQLITHDVSRRIEEFPFHVEYFSVRLKSRVHKVISLVDIGSNDEVKMVGICGSKIRRSTMARALCNSIARHFEDLWYFHGVHEIARGYASTWDDFQNRITQPWFPQRKILVILDGAEVDQLGAIRECDRFVEGSRIIVVTRDKQLLVSHGVEIIYDDEWNSTLDEKGKNPKEEEDLKAKLAVFPSGWSYDVFLSYRADDECSSFVRRLYNSLCQRGVRAFDNDELGKTSRENLKALQESRTVIIVISKNYASSPSCLNSLATIHECFRKERRFIYPIFYDVEPLELQHQTGSYGEVFTRLGKMFKQYMQKWRLALFEVADSRDMCHFSPGLVTDVTEDEDIIQLITHEVSARIEEFPFRVEYFSMRLESQVQKVISLVDIWSNEEVKMVGLCGGRICRSTMARALCNSIACHFEDLWYFCGVSSSCILRWTKNDLSYAIKMKLLIYEITRGYGFTLDDFHNLIRQPWFPQKKILVILDGDEVLDQLGAIRECDWFGEGSRVIVVTRDKQLLVSNGVEIIYDDERNSTLDEKGKNPKEEVDLKAKLAVFPSGWSYDVFLSYRGDDNCSSFVRHLYNFLCQQGVRAFDNDELGKTSRENLKALQESRIAIIVISKNYASSPSCLNSLAIIHKCFRMERRLIYPIFYDVEPLEVQYQTKSYGEVFARLEKIFKQHVQKWRLALSEVANSGVMSHVTPRMIVMGGYENAIKDISRAVYARLTMFPLSVWDFSVGLESLVQKVISFVDIGSNEEVKMVGICGIRKSTIARAVCNVIAHHFEDLWYFHGVSEIARGYASTWDDFLNWITQPWFPQRKILVILDGIEVLDQLRAIRDCDRFGQGSMIFVVIRDKQLLVSHGVEIIYDDEWNSTLDEKGKNLKEEKDLKAKHSVLPYKWTYDVFLSYRGDDACSSFVRCLYNSLCRRGVRVFVNDELLNINRKKFKALGESRTIIIVISKNFGSSSSLSNINERFGIECRFINPISYDLMLSLSKNQWWSYNIGLSTLGKMSQKESLALSKIDGKIRPLQNLALSKIDGNIIPLQNFSSRIATKDDENAIKWITGEVYARLAMFPLSIWDFSVGLVSRVQKVISLVDIESNEKIKMVGICGIRKSAIARAVCNVIARHFEDLWYFHDFHEIVRGHALTVRDFQIRVLWPPPGKNLVIFEIPDGAEKLDHLWLTTGKFNQFGEGSRIIVTASDKDLLVTNGIKIIMDEIEDPNER
ncbi:hypothetical protein K1719_027599 [Acacia pycnantha]|nr:hypothetical protein K1719_027599 [Acacia pycnantha]